MPCEFVLLRVDFFKMADVAMETKKGDLKKCWIPFIKLHETL
jgi:hypothetical protein